MTNQSLPIACILSDSELRERRESVLREIRSEVTEVIEIDHGYVYQFPGGGERITDLARLIALEHQCCPFLTFRLTVEPENGPVLLEITGPEGTKDFLSEVFNSSS